MAESPCSAPPCPACGTHATRHLSLVSEGGPVNYYDCTICHHLWMIDKDDSSVVRHFPFLSTKKEGLRS